MANPIGDMIIKVDLDSTGVSKSMTGLKRQLKSVNTEMRANLSSFSRSDKSMAKYSTMMDGLTKRQRIQKGAVEEARKEYEKMADTYGVNSAKAEGAAIKLNEQVALYEETGREISNLKSEMAAFQKEQDIANSGWTKSGNSLTGFGDKLGAISGKMRAVGGTLTKSITLPALGVAAALGGITAKLGWDRLVGLDSAQAQLKGLGYNTKEVGRISDQVTSAIDGGMTTMAEGTSVAAGALAAGVKEGAELKRYIKLVGDAAVGSNRPVNDMAQIFNRVQGSGKLMTQELNSIEQGMPGFAMAMAESLGVSQEKFREMVTNGEIDSKQFMDVMEDFAGGMASAYADSWRGMVANTKAYIGIIGESLLGGVFEKSKESIAEFIEVLKSDAVANWAEQAGQKIGEAFTNIIDKVKAGINWFRELDTEHQKLIGKLGLIAVSIGPVLTVLGVFGGFIAKISSGLGSLFTLIARGGGLFSLLGTAFTALISPVGLIVAAIALLTTGFVLLYKKSETFRNFIQSLGATLKQVFLTIMEAIQPMIEKIVSFFQENIPKLIEGLKNIISNVAEFIEPAIVSIVEFFSEIISTLKDFWNKEGEQIVQALQKVGSIIGTVMVAIWEVVKWAFDKILAIIDFIMPAVLFIIQTVWGNIKGVITGALDVIMGVVKVFSGLFTGDFSKMWEGVKQIFTGAITAVWNYIQLLFVGRILKGIGSFVSLFGGLIKGLWSKVTGIFTKSGNGIFNFVSSIFSKILTTITNILNSVRGFISTIWNAILNFFKGILTKIFNTVKSTFTKTKNTISSILTSVRNTISTIWDAIFSFLKKIVLNIFNNVKNRFTNLKKSITAIFNAARSVISTIWNAIFSFLKKIVLNIFNNVKNRFTNLKNTISSIFNAVRSAISKVWNSIFSTIKRIATNIWNSVKGIFTNLKNGVVNLTTNAKNGIVGQWNKIKSSVTNLASGMWTSVKKTFDKMVSGAKALPGKIGSGIRGAKNKAVDGVKSLGNSIVGKFGGVVNGFVKGINNVTGKLGIKKKISEWNVPKFAKGTGGHEGGAMIVGDKYGRELVTMPNGRSFVSPDTDTLLPNMPKGTKVLPNKQTEELLDSPIPMYAKGTGWASKLKEKISGGLSKAKDWMGNVWDYAKNPGKLVGKIVDKLGLKITGLSGGAMSMANGGFTYAKDKGKEYLKNMFKKSDEGGNAPNIKGGAKAWDSTIRKAAARMNESVTNNHVNGIIAQIQRESGGNQKITQSSAVWDVNTASGNPARGLLQYIPQTFDAYKMKGRNNIYNGYDQLLAFFNNKTWRRDLPYGKRGWGPRGGRKYATGGLVKKKQLAMLAEEGHPEMVIPTDPKRRSDAMKLLALTGKMLGLDGDDRGSVRPNSLPNVKQGNNSGQSDEVAYLKQSVELLTEMMEHLVKGKDVKEINQHITINSPDAISPADNARKIKQATRQLAAEWR